MLNVIKKSNYLIISLFVFAFFILSWFYLQLYIEEGSILFEYFADTYWIPAVLAGIYGLLMSRKWGGFSSLIGRAIQFFSLGLLAQSFGQITYTIYYLILEIDVPYPSIGDIGFFGSIPLYILGVWYLGRVVGIKYALKSWQNILLSLIMPLLVLTGSYYMFLSEYTIQGTPMLEVILDFGYPLGQAIYISLAILVFLLSRGVLGGIMRYRIFFILFALVIQYSADFTFLYQVNRGLWEAGRVNDFIYLMAYFVMFLALITLRGALSEISDVTKSGSEGQV
jgi:hypothetical protein